MLVKRQNGLGLKFGKKGLMMGFAVLMLLILFIGFVVKELVVAEPPPKDKTSDDYRKFNWHV